jgi:hypothetical protein
MLFYVINSLETENNVLAKLVKLNSEEIVSDALVYY